MLLHGDRRFEFDIGSINRTYTQHSGNEGSRHSVYPSAYHRAEHDYGIESNEGIAARKYRRESDTSERLRCERSSNQYGRMNGSRLREPGAGKAGVVIAGIARELRGFCIRSG
jgi:hypothetical protein